MKEWESAKDLELAKELELQSELELATELELGLVSAMVQSRTNKADGSEIQFPRP